MTTQSAILAKIKIALSSFSANDLAEYIPRALASHGGLASTPNELVAIGHAISGAGHDMLRAATPNTQLGEDPNANRGAYGEDMFTWAKENKAYIARTRANASTVKEASI